MKQDPSFPRRLLLAGAVAASVWTAGTAFAQTAPGADDLRALRFYIEQEEEVATQAELRRLRMEFPDWNPPETLSDLLTTGPTTELSEIYARIARNDVEGAHRILEQVETRYPEWDVPSDLRAQLALAEGQSAFDQAVDARDSAAALRIATQTPSLLRCDRVNNTWNLAELQVGSGNPGGALAVYRQIVSTCTTLPEIVATIEKAEAVTTDPQLADLIAVAKRRFPNQAATFDALGQRLMAGRGKPPTAPAPTAAPPSASVQSAPTPTPRQAPPDSAVPGSSPSKLMRSGDGRLAQTRAAARAGNYRVCLAQSVRPGSLEIAYERAWCAYNMDRPLEAMAYFTAVTQGGLGSEVSRDARFGLALSFLKLDMTDNAAQIAATTDLTPKQRREVESIILDQRGVRAYETDNYRDAINFFDALENIEGSLPRDLALLRGYAYLNMGDHEAAREQFLALHNALATPESRAALRAVP